MVPVPSGPTVYPLSDAEAAGLTVKMDRVSEVVGPLAAGTTLGRLVWSTGGKELYSLDLRNLEATKTAPWWEGLWDRIVLFFRGLMGKPAPKTAVLHK